MKFFAFLVLISINSYALDMNFMEAHHLRLSSQENVNNWLMPHTPDKDHDFAFTFFGTGNKDVPEVYDDIQSKKQDKIENRINSSYGKPYDAAAKVQFLFQKNSFRQAFSTNGGAVFVVTDPVFPELRGMIFHDYMASSSYKFQMGDFSFRPQLSYGFRRTLFRELTAGDLVQEKLNVKFNKAANVGLVEFGLQSAYKMSHYGEVFFDVNALPLTNYEYKYWETILGYRTPLLYQRLFLYAAFSPLYGGYYDVSRTYKLGANLSLVDSLRLHLFTLDDFYPGAEIQYRLGIVEVAVMTFERAYDDYGHQKSRQYGAALRLVF